MIEIVIPGEPCAQGRPRFARRGKFVQAYDPPKSRNWKATAQQHMRYALAGAAPLHGPLHCEVVAVFTCPSSDWRKGKPQPRRWHAKRPDCENVVKAVLDSATGVVWLDDSQVSRVLAVKVIGQQGEAPYVRIKVAQLYEDALGEWAR